MIKEAKKRDFKDIFNIIFGISTIIALLSTIYYGHKSSKLEKQRKKLDWTDLQSCANDMGKQLKKSGFKPDILFTPGLRGATFANLIQNEISEKTPVYVGLSYWKETIPVCESKEGYILLETNKWYVLIPKLLLSQKDKKILIIDDYVMSGDFLQSMIKILTDSGLDKNNIQSMAVATTKIAIENHKEPNYFWWTTIDSNFYFPWGKAK